MSRIGKKPILIPNNFNINLNFNILNLEFNNKIIFIKLNINYINILINNNYLFININNIKNKKIYKLANAYYGTIRSIINNSIIGLINNFKKKIILNGIGFKYLIEDKNIILNLGYSHIIKYKLHKDVNIEYINNLEFVLYSHDKQLLGKTVSEIKLLKKIDAYKGKGIRSEDDIIKLKESKKNK